METGLVTHSQPTAQPGIKKKQNSNSDKNWQTQNNNDTKEEMLLSFSTYTTTSQQHPNSPSMLRHSQKNRDRQQGSYKNDDNQQLRYKNGESPQLRYKNVDNPQRSQESCNNQQFSYKNTDSQQLCYKNGESPQLCYKNGDNPQRSHETSNNQQLSYKNTDSQQLRYKNGGEDQKLSYKNGDARTYKNGENELYYNSNKKAGRKERGAGEGVDGEVVGRESDGGSTPLGLLPNSLGSTSLNSSFLLKNPKFRKRARSSSALFSKLDLLEINAIIGRLRLELEVRDITSNWKYYKYCFDGASCVNWIIDNEPKLKKRHEACMLAQHLLNRLIFCAVEGVEKNATFEDSKTVFYTFQVDDYVSGLDSDMLTSIVEKMKDPKNGVGILDRRYLLRSYSQCFVGSEAVEWFMENLSVQDRAEGIQLGQTLLNTGFISHVANKHPFEDAHIFYHINEQNYVRKTGYLGIKEITGPNTKTNLDDKTGVKLCWICIRMERLYWYPHPYSTDPPLGVIPLCQGITLKETHRNCNKANTELEDCMFTIVTQQQKKQYTMVPKSCQHLQKWVQVFQVYTCDYENQLITQAENNILNSMHNRHNMWMSYVNNSDNYSRTRYWENNLARFALAPFEVTEQRLPSYSYH